MNARQALRAVSERLRDIEIVLAGAQNDIVLYNQCIDSMIQGGSPCEFCEDFEECQLQAKADGKGCAQWWLRYSREEVRTADDRSESILPTGSAGGEEAENPVGKIEAL